jgi:hypothetical protein
MKPLPIRSLKQILIPIGLLSVGAIGLFLAPKIPSSQSANPDAYGLPLNLPPIVANRCKKKSNCIKPKSNKIPKVV